MCSAAMLRDPAHNPKERPLDAQQKPIPCSLARNGDAIRKETQQEGNRTRKASPFPPRANDKQPEVFFQTTREQQTPSLQQGSPHKTNPTLWPRERNKRQKKE
jgi:hypothetical protein